VGAAVTGWCARLVVVAAALVAAALAVPGMASAFTYYGAVCFVDARRGWFAGGQGADFVVWSTSDGGRTLKRQAGGYAAGGGGTSLAFWNRSLGLWGGDTGLKLTANGGCTCTRPSQAGFGLPRDVQFSSARVAWASSAWGSAGAGGSICRSTDGGATWHSVKTVHLIDGNEFGDLACPSPNRCYVLGDGGLRGLWVTTNGGADWIKRRLPGSSRWMAALAFPTANTGWVFGGAGAIYKTDDAGRTWTAQESGTDETLRAACFVDSRVGFAAGDGGQILRTLDGGAHWEVKQTKATSGLTDIFFTDRRHGWAVGDSVRLRTVDGGETWVKL